MCYQLSTCLPLGRVGKNSTHVNWCLLRKIFNCYGECGMALLHYLGCFQCRVLIVSGKQRCPTRIELMQYKSRD